MSKTRPPSQRQRPRSSPPDDHGAVAPPPLTDGDTLAAALAESHAAASALEHLLAVLRGALARVEAGQGTPAPLLLTADQVARRLGVEPDTVNAWCRRGRFADATHWGRAGWRIPEYHLYEGRASGGLPARSEAASAGRLSWDTAPTEHGTFEDAFDIGALDLAIDSTSDNRAFDGKPQNRARPDRYHASAGDAAATARHTPVQKAHRAPALSTKAGTPSRRRS